MQHTNPSFRPVYNGQSDESVWTERDAFTLQRKESARESLDLFRTQLAHLQQKALADTSQPHALIRLDLEQSSAKWRELGAATDTNRQNGANSPA